MTRRRLLLPLGVAVAVLVVAGAAWWLTLPRPGITEANRARIKPGMRLEEVEAILGCPPGRYVGGRLKDQVAPGPYAGGDVRWADVGQDGVARLIVDVEFGNDGRVKGARVLVPARPSLFQWLASTLRRLLP